MKSFAFLLLAFQSLVVFTESFNFKNEVGSRFDLHMFSNNRLEFVHSGDGFLANQKKSHIKNYKLKVNDFPPSEREFLISFDASFPWNENFVDLNSVESKVLNESFTKYFDEVFQKLKIVEIKVKTKSVRVESNKIPDHLHFSVSADCQNVQQKVFDNLLECANVIRSVVKMLNFDELLPYFHEIGYSEMINPGQILKTDF